MLRTTFDSEEVMLTSLMLIAPLALAGGSRDRAEDARDHREDVQDRREDHADAQHHGGAADRREDVRDRREDVADRREDVRDRHDAGPPRGHAAAYAPRHHTPVAYGPRRGPPHPTVVVVRRAPPPPPRGAPAPPVARPAAPEHDVVLSVDAVDALTGLGNVSGEFRLGKIGGFVAQGGVGADGDGARYTLGTEIRGYLTGDFDGGLFLAIGGEYGNAHTFSPTSPGFSVGPSIGAKHTFDVPLTLQASIGVQRIWTVDYRGVAPSANLSLGWAF